MRMSAWLRRSYWQNTKSWWMSVKFMFGDQRQRLVVYRRGHGGPLEAHSVPPNCREVALATSFSQSKTSSLAPPEKTQLRDSPSGTLLPSAIRRMSALSCPVAHDWCA